MANFQQGFLENKKSTANKRELSKKRKEISSKIEHGSQDSVLDWTVILWNQILELFKSGKYLQSNSDFLNKIKERI